MNRLSCNGFGSALLPRSMIISLGCSLLAHLTAFACSYNWPILPEVDRHPTFMVELVDLPIPADMEQVVKGDGSMATGGKTDGSKDRGGENEVSHHSTYLSAKNPSPWRLPEGRKTDRLIPPAPEGEATVSLDSQELKYVSYLSKIKKKIEPRWHYPERAQEIGLQGKLSLYFTIDHTGHLNKLELLNSSGHVLLDNEALKAVREAAPYHPLPDRLNISRLNIMATFEYRISPYHMSRFHPSHHGESL